MPGPYASAMAATVRLGTCSFADEGLLKHWYPRGVSSPKARLAYYGERFDTVEVDSPYYHLPDPEVTGRWAQRTPPEFVFHVKAHATMTGHQEPRAAWSRRSRISGRRSSRSSCPASSRASSSSTTRAS